MIILVIVLTGALCISIIAMIYFRLCLEAVSQELEKLRQFGIKEGEQK